MACQISYTLANIDDTCRTNPSQGGIKELLIADYHNVSKSLNAETGNTKYINTITMITGTTFVKYSLAKNTSSLEMAGEYTDSSIQYRNTVSFQLIKIDNDKRAAMMALDQTPLVVIVHDANDMYWYLGYNNYASVTASSAQTGTNQTDVNHCEITIEDVSAERPFSVAQSVIESLPVAE
jgi:hypothetical protein